MSVIALGISLALIYCTLSWLIWSQIKKSSRERKRIEEEIQSRYDIEDSANNL